MCVSKWKKENFLGKKGEAQKVNEEVLENYKETIRSLETLRKELYQKAESLQNSLTLAESKIGDLNQEKESLSSQLKEQGNLLETERQIVMELKRRVDEVESENWELLSKIVTVNSELIHFCDLIKSMSNRTVEEFADVINDKIEHALSEYGVTIAKESDGEFNPITHRVVDIRETTDMSLDNSIAEVVRPGFWVKSRCLIPQDVIVFIFRK